MAVKRVEKLLQTLVEAETDEDVMFATREPARLAYQLHEALRVCEKFPEYKHFAILRDKYKIRVRSSRVLMERRLKSVVAIKVDNRPLQRMTIDGVDNLLGIVGAATVNKVSEIFFPDANLSQNDLLDLYNWARQFGYFVISHDDAGVTITKVDPGPIAWEPTNVSSQS